MFRFVPPKTLRPPLWVKLTLPSMVTKFAMFSDRLSAKKAKPLTSPVPNFTAMVRPLMVTDSSMARPVVFTRKPARPPTLTPPAATAISPESTPARPCGKITNAPSALRRPFPETVRLTFAMPRRVTLLLSLRVACSKRKSPCSTTLLTVTSVSNAVTCRYGPAGRLSSIVSAPSAKVSFTGASVVLIRMPSVLEMLTPVIADEASVADSSPATPCWVRTKAPSPFSTDSSTVLPLLKLSRASRIETRTTFCPSATVV